MADFANAGILYKGHDALAKTTIQLDSVRMVGLDTLTQFEPLDNVGRYTLQNQIAWEYLAFELEATIEIKPSTLENSIIASPGDTRVLEQVQIFFGIDDLVADVGLLAAMNQDLLESLRFGSLLQMENIMPCLLSTIFQMELSTFSVEANDILTPNLNGFVSNGLDRVFSDAMDAAFLMYEKILLNASPAFFQKEIRSILNQRFLQDNIVGAACPPFSWTNDDDFVDFRDLLFQPTDALLAGGSGNEPYGDLFSSFVMPNLRQQVFQVESFNSRFVRPFTKEQSGIEGTLSFPSTLIEYVDDEPSPLYDH
jgi:hypothetical protein